MHNGFKKDRQVTPGCCCLGKKTATPAVFLKMQKDRLVADWGLKRWTSLPGPQGPQKRGVASRLNYWGKLAVGPPLFMKDIHNHRLKIGVRKGGGTIAQPGKNHRGNMCWVTMQRERENMNCYRTNASKKVVKNKTCKLAVIKRLLEKKVGAEVGFNNREAECVLI